MKTSVEILSEMFALMDRREKLRADLRETNKDFRQLWEEFESDEDAVPALAAVRETLERAARKPGINCPAVAQPLAIQHSPIATALDELPTEADKFAEDFKNTLNHRSGCGLDVSVLRKRIFDYLIAHGGSGQWLSRTNMCSVTFAWKQFGKRVVDPLLDSMIAEGVIEVRSTELGRQVRLKVKNGEKQ